MRKVHQSERESPQWTNGGVKALGSEVAERLPRAIYSDSGSDFRYSTRSSFSCVVSPKLNRVL